MNEYEYAIFGNLVKTTVCTFNIAENDISFFILPIHIYLPMS